MTGKIDVGSPVKTLHFTKAVYGRVTAWKRGSKRFCIVEGRTQPGARKQKFQCDVENLDLVTESDLAPEDRIEADNAA